MEHGPAKIAKLNPPRDFRRIYNYECIKLETARAYAQENFLRIKSHDRKGLPKLYGVIHFYGVIVTVIVSFLIALVCRLRSPRRCLVRMIKLLLDLRTIRSNSIRTRKMYGDIILS